MPRPAAEVEREPGHPGRPICDQGAGRGVEDVREQGEASGGEARVPERVGRYPDEGGLHADLATQAVRDVALLVGLLHQGMKPLERDVPGNHDPWPQPDVAQTRPRRLGHDRLRVVGVAADIYPRAGGHGQEGQELTGRRCEQDELFGVGMFG